MSKTEVPLPNQMTPDFERQPKHISATEGIKSILPSWGLRVLGYYNRHGFRRTLGQTAAVVRRGILQNRKVLYCCDLRALSPMSLADGLTVERREKLENIGEDEWNQIATVIDLERARRTCRNHFAAGALMWLIRANGSVAAYGWTLTGGTLEPYFYPLGERDVHLFDFLTFPEYRGRHINSSLVNFILSRLAAEGKVRAYLETWEWNDSMLRSLRRTSFKQMALARKTTLLGHTFVEWTVPSTGLAPPTSPE
jgi:ribosomal protein S18 acetylase RimI-like enzyme